MFLSNAITIPMSSNIKIRNVAVENYLSPISNMMREWKFLSRAVLLGISRKYFTSTQREFLPPFFPLHKTNFQTFVNKFSTENEITFSTIPLWLRIHSLDFCLQRKFCFVSRGLFCFFVVGCFGLFFCLFLLLLIHFLLLSLQVFV